MLTACHLLFVTLSYRFFRSSFLFWIQSLVELVSFSLSLSTAFQTDHLEFHFQRLSKDGKAGLATLNSTSTLESFIVSFAFLLLHRIVFYLPQHSKTLLTATLQLTCNAITLQSLLISSELNQRDFEIQALFFCLASK